VALVVVGAAILGCSSAAALLPVRPLVNLARLPSSLVHLLRRLRCSRAPGCCSWGTLWR